MEVHNPSEIFVEVVTNVSHANGVFRVTLGVNESPSESVPAVKLMIPANQLGPMLQGIANAAKNIGEQIQLKVENNLGDQK